MGKRKYLAAGAVASGRIWLTPKAVSAIVKQARCADGPYDPDHLAADLNKAIVEFCLRAKFRNSNDAARQVEIAKMIAQQPDGLADALQNNEPMLDWIVADWQRVPKLTGADLRKFDATAPVLPTQQAVLLALRSLARSAQEQKVRLSKSWLKNGWTTHCSPAEWLAGHALAETYQRHFAKNASISRPAGKPEAGGPFVRFVGAVFDAAKIYKNKAGQPYSPEFVAKALPAARKGRRRGNTG